MNGRRYIKQIDEHRPDKNKINYNKPLPKSMFFGIMQHENMK